MTMKFDAVAIEAIHTAFNDKPLSQRKQCLTRALKILRPDFPDVSGSITEREDTLQVRIDRSLIDTPDKRDIEAILAEYVIRENKTLQFDSHRGEV